MSSGGHYRYGDLTIVSSADPGVAFTPSGADIPRLATATITFLNPPLVTDAARPSSSIDPPIEGSFAWDGDRTLLFQPAFPGWQRGQRYLMRVDGPTAGLARDYTHAFTVEGGLEVAYVIPGDGDVEVPVEAQILVQFNRSVAALTVLQEGDAPPVLEFDPPLAGKGEWLNTSLYRFIPSDLQPATAYRVRIPAGLTSAADGVLDADFAWSFETIQPVVASFEPANDTKWVEPDAPVVVTFNQPMDQRLDGGAGGPARRGRHARRGDVRVERGRHRRDAHACRASGARRVVRGRRAGRRGGRRRRRDQNRAAHAVHRRGAAAPGEHVPAGR